MFEIAEPVTICDQLLLLFFSELEAVSLRESTYISFDGLIEHFCLHLIELGKVGIHYHLLPSDGEDAALDGVWGIDFQGCGSWLYVGGFV